MSRPHKETPDTARRRNLERLQTEGLDAAVEAAIHLMRDPSAPAQAKSAAINATFRAAGLYGEQDDGGDIPLSEMTSEQLARTVARLRAKAEQLLGDGGN